MIGANPLSKHTTNRSMTERDARLLQHNCDRIECQHMALREDLDLLAKNGVPVAVLKALRAAFDVDANHAIRVGGPPGAPRDMNGGYILPCKR